MRRPNFGPSSWPYSSRPGLSGMLRAFGWQLLLSPTGPISKLWSALTGLGPLENLRYNFTAVVVGLVSAMLPAGVLSVLAALPSRSKTEWLAASEIGRPHHVFTVFAPWPSRPGIIVGVWLLIFLCRAASPRQNRDSSMAQPKPASRPLLPSLVNDGVPALLAFGTLLTGMALCFLPVRGGSISVPCASKAL